MCVYIYIYIYIYMHQVKGTQLERFEDAVGHDVERVGDRRYIYTYILIYVCIHPSIYLSIHPSIYLSIYLYLYIYISIYLYLYLPLSLSIYMYINTHQVKGAQLERFEEAVGHDVQRVGDRRYVYLSMYLYLSIYIYIYRQMCSRFSCI